jgi:quercetin dioxygenase-like cupin family protein
VAPAAIDSGEGVMEQSAGHTDQDYVSLAGLLAAADGSGPVWTRTSADLNVNVLSFPAEAGVPTHVNDEVDVLIVALAGEGELAIDGDARRLGPGDLCLIPKGSARSIRALGGRFVYVSCHRRRGGLMPA